jgi:hypothetical protein
MSSNDRTDGEYSLTDPNSAAQGQGTPQRIDRDSATVGESAGGFVGASTGMAFGAIAGPVGLVIGGLAGAVGGWWAGREIAEAITEKDDVAFRNHFESTPDRLSDRSYEELRPAYAAGHLAARNPDYAGRSFDSVESDLRRGWNSDVAKQSGEWPAARRYARAAFERARGAPPSGEVKGAD